jgi:alpha-mannosidase
MEEQDPSKKRKRGRPKGSKNKKKSNTSDYKKSEDVSGKEYDIYIGAEDVDGVDEEAFQEMLVEALRTVSKEKKYNRNCKIALSSTVEEFISSFILIGFDLNGDPVEIVKARSALETDALGMSLQKFITKYFSRQLPPEL